MGREQSFLPSSWPGLRPALCPALCLAVALPSARSDQEAGALPACVLLSKMSSATSRLHGRLLEEANDFFEK